MASPEAGASAEAAALPSPWPPLAEQPPLSCPEDGFSTRSIPAEALGADGLPLPAALCIGARLDALPLLRGRPHQGQPADEGLVQGSGPARVYQVAGARVVLRLQGSDTPRVAGALVSAAGPEGLSATAARAWLRALAPCATVPDFGASSSWYLELSSAKTPGFEADQIRMLATTSDTPDWQAEQRRLLGPAAALSSFAPQAPTGRWLGVVAMAYYLRQ